MARWSRAIAALPFHEGRVLDVGCAFGFATRMLRRRGYDTVGVDSWPPYIERAQRVDPKGAYLLADVAHMPLPDASFDGVIFLDVMEHLADERGAVREIARVLDLGGTLVLSVPHRGPLAWLDSLNVYAAFVRATRHGIFPPEIVTTGVHHHYSLAQVRAVFGEDFTVARVTRTGFGIAELVNLPLLILFRWVLLLDWLYQFAAYLYYAVYLVEDVVPLGPLGYHMMVVARRRPSANEVNEVDEVDEA